MTNYEKAAKILAVMARIDSRTVDRLEPEDIIKKCDEKLLDRLYRGMCRNV